MMTMITVVCILAALGVMSYVASQAVPYLTRVNRWKKWQREKHEIIAIRKIKREFRYRVVDLGVDLGKTIYEDIKKKPLLTPRGKKVMINAAIIIGVVGCAGILLHVFRRRR